VPDDEEIESDKQCYVAYRFSLDRCTYVNGVLSDNKFHPDHPAWFAKPEIERRDRPQDTTYLKGVADFVGQTEEDMIASFCSEDPRLRAMAWQAVGDYHGFENIDDYPLRLTRAEAEERYGKELDGVTA
jgi:hypothetical protein